MIFLTFAKMLHHGISRPSLADKKYFYFSKLYPEKYESRGGRFTTIRLRGKGYVIGKVMKVCLDDKSFHLFDARITGITPIDVNEISENFSRGDADMTPEEFKRFLKIIYPKKKYGDEPEFDKISLEVVE